MSEDQTHALHERLDRIEAISVRVERALIGEPTLGNHGIVHRIEIIETKVDRHDRKLMLWGGLAAAAGAAAAFAKDMLK